MEQNVLKISTQQKQHVSLTLSDPLQLSHQYRLLPSRTVCLFADQLSPLTPPPCLRLQASRTSSQHSEERAKWPRGRSQHKHSLPSSFGAALLISSSEFSISARVLCRSNNKPNWNGLWERLRMTDVACLMCESCISKQRIRRGLHQVKFFLATFLCGLEKCFESTRVAFLKFNEV